MAACPKCGEENPDRARLCMMCATPLAVAVERRERRVVSVLMADLQGFTSRAGRLDVEDVDAFLAPYRGELGREVERTGGVVSDFAGDGMMAVFGAPVAHEDDPERAVRAALAIRDSFLDAGSSARAADLHVRLGVTTGEVLVTLASEGVRATGDVVNIAARLESAAPTDGILVDEVTYRATNRVITLEPAEPISAKGKREPVSAWRVIEARSVVPEQARDQLPLVGRDAEADVLRDALDRSRSEPSTQLVSVIGEPGIGKSRLVGELGVYVEAMPELITWRRGRSLSYGEGVAFWALGEMVKGQAGILESDSAGVAEQKLGEAVDAVILDERDRGWVVRHLGPLVGLEAASSVGEGGRVEAFAAWRRFFEALAEDGATVLVFEDIHWADDALLDFIDLLADRAGALPLLIVCTARPELFQRRAGWAGGKTNATTISLRPLSGEETAGLVAGLLDQALLPAEVQQALLERAEGNPLYAQEYVRMLQDRDILTKQAGGWALTGDIVELPESIQGIIAARLDTLTAGEKSLIQDASVIGKTGWIGAVCALTERSTWQAEELLHSLERKQLLQRVRRSSIQGETEFQFGHALTRDVAYSQIRRADRAQKHLAAARWIEALAGERDDKAELLADHYTQAFTLREAMGEDTTTLAPKARAAYTEAGDQAAATHAHPAAARHYHAALTLTPPSDTHARATLLLGKANALFYADAADREILDAALKAQVMVQRWEAAAKIERMLSDWYEKHASSREDQDAHLARGAQYAARVPPTDTMCHIAADQVFVLITSGHAEQALALTSAMLLVADQAGLDIGRALLQQQRGSARVGLGDPDGVADLREAAEILADHAHQKTATAYNNLADAVRGLGDMAAADAAYITAAEWAGRLALHNAIDFVALEQAYQAYHTAQWDTAHRLLTEVTTTTNQSVDSRARSVRGRISLAHDHAQDALTDSTAIISHATSIGNDEDLYHGNALAARCHHTQGNDTKALEACERFLTRWHETGGVPGRAIELCEITPILATTARHQHIHDAAMLLPQTCRWRTALLHTANQNYAEAATLYHDIGSHPLTADHHLLAAQKATDQGRTSDASTHAQAVLAFAGQTGATLYQRQAEPFVRASA